MINVSGLFHPSFHHWKQKKVPLTREQKIGKEWEEKIRKQPTSVKEHLLITALWLASAWFDLAGYKHIWKGYVCGCKACRRALEILAAAGVTVDSGFTMEETMGLSDDQPIGLLHRLIHRIDRKLIERHRRLYPRLPGHIKIQ